MPFFSNQTDVDNFDSMLSKVYEEITPFWFVLDEEDMYGPKNIGVSSYSLRSAADIVDSKVHLLKTLKIPDHVVRVIPEIDIDCLDQHRVLPGIGDPKRCGIWWPNPGLSQA